MTQLLDAIDQGQPRAAEELLPLVYDELRRLAAQAMASEKAGQTLQPTALVHEAYVRLVGKSTPSSAQDSPREFANRRHFFAAAAQAMRRILVENVRRKRRLKRGGELRREAFDEEALATPELREDLVALDEALTRLRETDPLAAELVQLRYFAGLPMAEAAEILGLSVRTAERRWSYARAWLFRELQ